MVRKKLREIRKNAGLTQKEIAKKIGIDRASYANIELGKRDPSLEIAIKIANLFGKKVDDIFLINHVSKCNTANQETESA
ncbi:helix-turn-helix transcriptional regulator [Thermoanaerobacterium thermosaccharolyticum]|uniref:helix-turn-helix transcriptional regulator n=1 Tax=Thermoanaerobacterium thermosaccharolyticum TaxID=1517 RepID=UPI003DAA26A7